MKLYEFAPTPSCRRVSIFLKELGVDVERVQVNVREGENLADDFKQKSINGKVPMLELDCGVTICESVKAYTLVSKHSEISQVFIKIAKRVWKSGVLKVNVVLKASFLNWNNS